MKIFITGTAGFVGKELISQCQQQGIEYIAVDILESSLPNYHKMDIRSKDIITLIPEGADAVIHLAGLTSDPACKNKAYECFDANVMATLNLINAASKKKVKQFIFASSEWVYGPFDTGEIKDENSLIDINKLDSEYALSKLVVESNLRQKFSHGFCSVTILRFGIIYGSREKGSAVESIFNAVKSQDKVIVGSLKTGRCFIHVSDIVSGLIQSVGLNGFNILNLQGDSLITLKNVIETSECILNKKVKMEELDSLNINVKNISNKKAKEILNWQPKVNLREGLNRLNSFLSEKKGV